MDKKPLHLGLYSGLPRFESDAAFREQLRQSPKVLEPSIAARLSQRSKVTPAEKSKAKDAA